MIALLLIIAALLAWQSWCLWLIVRNLGLHPFSLRDTRQDQVLGRSEVGIKL